MAVLSYISIAAAIYTGFLAGFILCSLRPELPRRVYVWHSLAAGGWTLTGILLCLPVLSPSATIWLIRLFFCWATLCSISWLYAAGSLPFPGRMRSLLYGLAFLGLPWLALCWTPILSTTARPWWGHSLPAQGIFAGWLLLCYGCGALHLFRAARQSQAKEAECLAALRQRTVELERRVQERTTALRAARAIFFSLMDMLPMPVLLRNEAHESMRSNRALTQFMEKHHIKTLDDFTILDPCTRRPIPREEWPESRALCGETITYQECILAFKDGQEVHIVGHAAPLMAPGSALSVAFTFQDISPQKQADLAKDEFLAVLSHELLTPLTSIMGWAELAQDYPTDPRVSQAFTVIERNARRQKRLVDDLLDVSRIFHDKLHLSPQVTDLQQMAREVAEQIRPQVDERLQRLVIKGTDAALPVFADTKRLRQAINNLLTNAIKFSHPGGVITLTIQRDGHEARLSVNDTGVGIAPHALARLFTPFYQAHDDYQAGSLGLGLALVKGIVETHGGHITAESAGLGQGSTFAISLPLVVGATTVPVQGRDQAGDTPLAMR